MSAVNARIGLGTLLKIGDGAGSETFNTIGEVRTINFTGRTRPAVSATHMASTAAEYAAGLPDNGEISGEFNILGNDTYQEQLETDFEAGTCRNFQLVVPDLATSQYDFAGIITDLSDSYPLDDVMVRSFTVKVSGAVTKS